MIHLIDVTKQHGSRVLFRGASFQILPGTRTGLVGPNGAGKTTIFRLIVGEDDVNTGQVSCAKNTSIGYFSQDVGDMAGRSALEEVKSASADVVRLGEEIEQLAGAMAEPMADDEMEALLARYGAALEEFEHRGGYDLESRARTVLTGLGIGPDDHDRPVESFSGGWKMRIALARVIALNADVLLLDEPTNHLDVESIEWLEGWLQNDFRGALLMTTHDRDFMNRLVSRILEVANEAVTLYNGRFDFYLREREIRAEQLRAAHKRQQGMLAKEERFIARFAARASHASQVQSRVKKLDKIERIEVPAEQKTIHFEFAAPPRSGDDVARFEELSKRWPADPVAGTRETPVFDGASGTISRGDKIAVVGVNGAGKSTFLKVLAGQTEASGGSLQIGANVGIGYFSQHALELLEAGRSVLETLQDAMPSASLGAVRQLAAAFLFQGDDVDKRTEVLSGGERTRLVLATLLCQPHNLLVLDEPTNHLDLQSREILLAALQRFAGTVALVSHDRHFLRSLASRVFELDRGELRAYAGGYEYYRQVTAADDSPRG